MAPIVIENSTSLFVIGLIHLNMMVSVGSFCQQEGPCFQGLFLKTQKVYCKSGHLGTNILWVTKPGDAPFKIMNDSEPWHHPTAMP